MRIIEEYNHQENEVIRITDAEYSGDYRIKIHFNDGSEKLVDFKTFLTKSNHPSIKKYLEESLFEQFNIVDGNLNWNDYDLIFPLENLYEGKIDEWNQWRHLSII